MKASILAVILIIIPVLLITSCGGHNVDRGEVFSAVEMTIGLQDQVNPVKDDLIKRGLFTIPAENGTSGEIKIGEIEQLVMDGIYIIDEDGYLRFGPSYTPEPYFPVQKEVPIAYLLARFEGKLVLDDSGYLRIDNSLIIWPYGYSLKTECQDMLIVDDKGQTVARVGDNIVMGGGHIPAYSVEERIGHPLPEGCEGPYWLANPIETSDI